MLGDVALELKVRGKEGGSAKRRAWRQSPGQGSGGEEEGRGGEEITWKAWSAQGRVEGSVDVWRKHYEKRGRSGKERKGGGREA